MKSTQWTYDQIYVLRLNRTHSSVKKVRGEKYGVISIKKSQKYQRKIYTNTNNNKIKGEIPYMVSHALCFKKQCNEWTVC